MFGSSLRARVLRTTALLAGLLVLVLSVVTSVLAARSQRITAQDAQLTVLRDQQVNALASYFERSRAINSLLADNPVFADFYRAPGTLREKIRRGGPVLLRINAALGYLERLYPGRISEACFIDGSGAEIARVVNGTPAAPGQLSAYEAANPFFAPTLALPAGQVYQGKAYESPDTHEQVLSNATVVSAAGSTGIVHFEITLESFRTATADDGSTATIVDADTGQVLVDSRETTASRAADVSFTGLVRSGRAGGITTIGERRVAFQRVPPTANNANSWYVVVSAPRVGRGWTHGVGVGSLTLLAAALLTMLVAGVSWRNHQRSVRRRALHDALTGLPNRAYLVERLRQELRVNQRGAASTAVVIIDLDRFKEVNDMFGDHYGDLLLTEVARRVAAVAGDDMVPARLGGDEFAVLVPSCTESATTDRLARRLLAVVHDSFVVNGVTLDVEASVGAAVAPAHGTEPEDLLRHAETAVLTAKDRRSGYEQYDPAARRNAPNRLALLGELRRALDVDDQILLHYQPKVSLADGRLVGVEALVRWQHPVRGMVTPDSFIPVAESTALIHVLTTRVLTIACAQARTWLRDGRAIPVAVNLSARCLMDLALPRRVLDLLAEYGLPVSALHLEITESAVMADPHRAMTVLQDLRASGVRLSLDDFGTGHSSMSYLRRLPVDELKIDKSFVKEITASADAEILVRSIIDLAHNLGLSVVAEGVENARVLAILRELGCDIAQGYHLGRPVPAAELDLPPLPAATARTDQALAQSP